MKAKGNRETGGWHTMRRIPLSTGNPICPEKFRLRALE